MGSVEEFKQMLRARATDTDSSLTQGSAQDPPKHDLSVACTRSTHFLRMSYFGTDTALLPSMMHHQVGQLSSIDNCLVWTDLLEQIAREAETCITVFQVCTVCTSK